MRRALIICLATIAALCAVPARAQCSGGYCYRPAGRVVYYQPAPAPVRWVYVQPAAAAPAPAPAPQTIYPVQQLTAADEAGAFLAALNQWRAWHGRGPLAWDVTLASWAAAEAGIHTVRPAGTSQCWSGYRSLLTSLSAWQASPAHAAILLSGTTIGASPCPSGATANVR
jgi:hypothetical protein